MTREQQLEHRIAMIQDDLNKLIEFIDEERMMERFDKASKYTESAWTHIINMEIACDLNDNESLRWTKSPYDKYEVGIDEDTDGTRTIASFKSEADAKSFMYNYQRSNPDAKVFIDTCTFHYLQTI